MTDVSTSAPNTTLKGVILGLTAFALFSTHDAVIKTLGASYSPFQIVFFVVLLSFPFVSLMLIRDKAADNLRPNCPGWTALRTAAVVVTGISAFYAFSVLPLAQAYAILFASPLLITILSIPILGEQVRAYRWAAVILGLIGVVVVLRPGSAPLGLGHAAALMAALGGSLASVIMRRIGNHERRIVMLLYPMMVNFIVMLCALPLVYQPVPLEHFGLFLLVAVLATLAMSLMIRAYQAADAAIVAPMQYSQIIWATVLGALFFGESPDSMTLLGAGIIILSGVYIVLRETRSGRSDNQPVLSTLSRRPETGTFPRVGNMMENESGT